MTDNHRQEKELLELSSFIMDACEVPLFSMTIVLPIKMVCHQTVAT